MPRAAWRGPPKRHARRGVPEVCVRLTVGLLYARCVLESSKQQAGSVPGVFHVCVRGRCTEVQPAARGFGRPRRRSQGRPRALRVLKAEGNAPLSQRGADRRVGFRTLNSHRKCKGNQQGAAARRGSCGVRAAAPARRLDRQAPCLPAAPRSPSAAAPRQQCAQPRHGAALQTLQARAAAGGREAGSAAGCEAVERI
ncbi:MAG: hypothetical protein J3K34DRAFT_401192, partial [Monoraphidium minutum]